jgi:hypothetical protein
MAAVLLSLLADGRFAPKSDLEQKSNLRITGPH